MHEAEPCNEGLDAYEKELNTEVLYGREYDLEQDLKSLYIPEFESELRIRKGPPIMVSQWCVVWL